MTPLLFAAALALSPGALQSYQPIDGRVLLAPPPSRPFGSFVRPFQVNTCAKLDAQAVAPDGVRMFKRLDQLPRGLLEHAVWRTVGGCPVREIVFGGQTYYLSSASPRLERLDPATAIQRR
jgi:hypothetical protein